MHKHGYVYILGSESTVLYIGVTSDIIGRIWEHKTHFFPHSFTSKCEVTKLLYFEEYENIKDAIAREKQLKNWHRELKLNLIGSFNSKLEELYEQLI